MVRETWVQSQVTSYQRLKKWYLIHPCLILSNKRYVSRVKWSNPGKGVVPSPTLQCCSYWKGSLLVALNYSHQLYFLLFHTSSKYKIRIKNELMHQYQCLSPWLIIYKNQGLNYHLNLLYFKIKVRVSIEAEEMWSH